VTDEERAKLYRDQREAEILCDDAHYRLKDYLRVVGKAAILDRQAALNQVARGLNVTDECDGDCSSVSV